MTLEDTVASGEDLEEECTGRLDRENMKRELWIAVDYSSGRSGADDPLPLHGRDDIERNRRTSGHFH